MLSKFQSPLAGPDATEPQSASTDEQTAFDRAMVWIYLAFCAISFFPFVAVEHPAIVDFSNHAARLALQCAINDPDISAMYSFHIGIIPNLALDLLNTPLCGTVRSDLVIKIFAVVSSCLIYVSCWHIQKRLYGKNNAFILFVPALSLNLVTAMGYFNFYVGVAIATTMIALIAGRRTSILSKILIGNVGGILLFFSHIFALALTVVFFFGWHLKRPFRVRNAAEASLRCAAMFAAPLLLIPLVPKDGAALLFSYAAKARALFAPFLVHANRIEIFLGLAIIVSFYLLWRHGRATLHPMMRLPLLMLAVYAVLLPSQLQAAVDIDARTFVALGILLCASLSLKPGEGRAARYLTGLAGLSLAIHLFIVATIWQPFSKQVKEFRAELNVLPPQSKVLSVIRAETDDEPLEALAPVLTYSHLTSYATLDRHVFNPLEFTGIGMQPLSSKAPFSEVDVPASTPIPTDIAIDLKIPRNAGKYPEIEYAHLWPSKFDFVIYYHFGGAPNFDPLSLNVARQGSFFSILAVKKTPA